MSRATATVLFTDLVGSTELRGQIGEEAAEELRRTHDRLLVEAVEAHSGQVIKGLGDGIMATFAGAADAVAAAVGIQQAIDRRNRSGTGQAPLSVRIGLSAGDVTFEDGDVHGTPVIEASRLCAAASGGEIMLSEVVRLLAGLADDGVTDRGFLELKGLSKPVSAWVVPWEPTAASLIPMPALLTDVGRIFVGRDAELDRLGQLWKEAAAGERRVALLAGEPGVGKTRLAAELAASAHEEGALVLVGRCDEDLGVPYQPFVEALRHFVDHAPADDLPDRLGRYGGELVRLVPELTERVPGLSPPLSSDPETERYRLFDAVAAWLSAMSTGHPALVVLDDLQWAAKPTLLLLRHVTRSPELRGLFILGTYRDTDIGHGHPLAEVLADMRRQGGVDRLSLRGLDPSGVTAYMEEAAGHTLDDADLDVARAVYEETEGNPFFVREVFRHLAESGVIARQGGRWTTRLPLDELGIPESVRDVVGRRLSRLSDDANQVLRIAAVVGAEFDLSVVQIVAGADENAVLASMEEASLAHLVIEATNLVNRYRFAHALVRDTLYGELSTSRRVSLHRHVAQAIETLHAGRLDDHLPALAHHWGRASAPAGDTAKAVEYATRAGDRALAQLAHDEAAAYYRQALEVRQAAGFGADGQACELMISLGEAQRRAGDPAHRQTLLDAARLAQSRGDTEALARAALANSRQAVMTSFALVDRERVAVLEAALQALGDDPGAVRARLLATLALELTFTGEPSRCRLLSDEALAEARGLGNDTTLAHVLAARSYTIAAPANVAERRANGEELEATARRIGDPMMHAWARFHRYRAHMELGALGEAQGDVEVLGCLADDLGDPTLRWCAAWVRAAYLAAVGSLNDAERHLALAAEMGATSGQPDAPIFEAALRVGLLAEQGRIDEVEGILASALEAYPRFFPLRAMAALVDAELGRLDDAKARFDALAASEFTDIPVNTVWMATITMLVLVASRLGDRPRSRILHELLVPYSELIAGTPALWFGSVSHYLALLDTILGRFNEAEAGFAEAEAIHVRIGAPIWLARTRLEWARMLLTRRQSGDNERARELLGPALATARELGLAKVERDTIALLQDGT
ncbi:MAG TPA: AAA family ATPase [Acidimicrobiia bacterium]|nr:AAA family ATPase [Acidimicrobiia bacterium]